LYYVLTVTVKVDGSKNPFKELRLLSTSSELRIKKSLLAVRQFLEVDLDVPINVKENNSSQLVLPKLEAFRK
jgi:hypothetical protein